MDYYIKTIYRSKIRNAGLKAPLDTFEILKKNAYKPLYIIETFDNSPFTSKIISFFQYLFIYLRINKNDTVFLQYPNYLYEVDNLYKLLVKKNPKIQILIHDLNSMKFRNNNIEYVDLLRKANVVIVHTPKMKEILEEKYGLQNDIRILHLFDYIVEKECMIPSEFKNSLVYAGNLTNNLFLKKIQLKTYVYGKKEDWLDFNKYIQYEGEFNPEDLSKVKGDWGLLWYGNNLDQFDDTLLGKYCTFISSHKASLYLAANKPIITWSKTAMGEFITKEKLGIVVDSLDNIEEVLSELTESDIEIIKHNVRVYSERIRNGEMLSGILKSL